MKTAYLILYFWHSIYEGYNQGGTGGPVVQIVSMPSLAICETIGKAAKEMIDKAKPAANPREEDNMSFHSYPAVFSCIEAESPQEFPTTHTIKKCEPITLHDPKTSRSWQASACEIDRR